MNNLKTKKFKLVFKSKREKGDSTKGSPISFNVQNIT